MWNAGLGESQAGIKIAERNTNNFTYADDTCLMAVSEEELKILLMRLKEKSEKVTWKSTFKNEDRGIWSHHFMAQWHSDRFHFLKLPNHCR